MTCFVIFMSINRLRDIATQTDINAYEIFIKDSAIARWTYLEWFLNIVLLLGCLASGKRCWNNLSVEYDSTINVRCSVGNWIWEGGDRKLNNATSHCNLLPSNVYNRPKSVILMMYNKGYGLALSLNGWLKVTCGRALSLKGRARSRSDCMFISI
jgi:hypothetical protein